MRDKYLITMEASDEKHRAGAWFRDQVQEHALRFAKERGNVGSDGKTPVIDTKDVRKALKLLKKKVKE